MIAGGLSGLRWHETAAGKRRVTVELAVPAVHTSLCVCVCVFPPF